jgi:hypothetical protein
MKKIDAVAFANTLSIQGLVRQHLSPPEGSDEAERHFLEVHISAKRVGNRTGVEATAATWRYLLAGSDWTLTARCVWVDGELLAPLAVHAVVESYGSKDGDQSKARLAANQWLRSLK